MSYCPIIFMVLACALPGAVHAAVLTLTADPAAPGVGKTVAVTVSIDSDTPVNAFSGSLTFSSDVLAVEAISDGNSIVSPWLERPTEDRAGSISFAGITPGGFSGRAGTLFTVFFTTKTMGEAHLALEWPEVLRNDGVGTSEPTRTSPLTLTVRQGSASSYTAPSDTTPPEPFMAYLAPDPTQAGTYLVSFSAVDKGSGIDRYDLSQTRLPAWIVAPVWHAAESGEAVTDSHLVNDVYVRAVDRAGNVRTAVIHRTHLLTPLESATCAIVIVAVALFFVRRRSSRQ